MKLKNNTRKIRPTAKIKGRVFDSGYVQLSNR